MTPPLRAPSPRAACVRFALAYVCVETLLRGLPPLVARGLLPPVGSAVRSVGSGPVLAALASFAVGFVPPCATQSFPSVVISG